MSRQIAIVTGAGRGIGRVIAGELARTGATVALVARSRDQLNDAATEIAAAGGRALAVVADVSDPASVAPMIDRVGWELGPVDLLVNNAAVAAPIGPLREADPAEWWRAVEINLRGSFLCAHAALPARLERRRGRIVFLTSRVAALSGR